MMSADPTAKGDGPRTTAQVETRPIPRRVAAIIPSRDISGPGRQLVAQARALMARGIDVLLIVPLRPGTEPRFAQFAARNGVPCQVVPDRGALDLALVRQVRDLLREWKPDLVQTHAYKATGIMYLLRSFGSTLPWIGFFHGTTDLGLKDRMFHNLDMRMLRSADRIVVMSGRQAEQFKSVAARTQVIHNAVLEAETAITNPGRTASKAAPHHTPVIGVIGRLSREKGVDILLKSLATLAARKVPFKAEIVGDGPERAGLQADVDARGLAEQIRFHGHIEDIASVYARLDLVVIPSRSEGLPNVLLEAMRHDIPVVATDVGAIGDILAAVPGSFRMVPSENAEALATAIATALAELDAPEAAIARARVAERFSLSGRVDRLLSLYSDVLSRRNG